MLMKASIAFVNLVLCTLHETPADIASNSLEPKIIQPPVLSLEKKKYNSTCLASELFSSYEDNKVKMSGIINEIVKEKDIWSKGLKKILEGEVMRNKKRPRASVCASERTEDGMVSLFDTFIKYDIKTFLSAEDDQADAAMLIMEIICGVCMKNGLVHEQMDGIFMEMSYNLVNEMDRLFYKFVRDNQNLDDEVDSRLKTHYSVLLVILEKIRDTCKEIVSDVHENAGNSRSFDAVYEIISANDSYISRFQQYTKDLRFYLFSVLNDIFIINEITAVEQIPSDFNEITGCSKIIDSLMEFLISLKDSKEKYLSASIFPIYLSYISTRRASNALMGLALDLYLYAIDDRSVYFENVGRFLCWSNIRWWAGCIGDRIPLQELGSLNKDEIHEWSARIIGIISDSLSKIERHSASDDDFNLASTNIKYLKEIYGLVAEPEKKSELQSFIYLADSRLAKGLESRSLDQENTPGPSSSASPGPSSRSTAWSGITPSAPEFEEIFRDPRVDTNRPNLQWSENFPPALPRREGDYQPSESNEDADLGAPPSYEEAMRLKNINEHLVDPNAKVSEEEDSYYEMDTEAENEMIVQSESRIISEPEMNAQTENEMIAQSESRIISEPEMNAQTETEITPELKEDVQAENKIASESSMGDVDYGSDETREDSNENVVDYKTTDKSSFFYQYLPAISLSLLVIFFALSVAKALYDYY